MRAVAGVLGLIPARSGSKGIPGKNVRPLSGRPLLAYAIECARHVASIDRIVITTDDPAIAELGVSFGAEAPFLRPPQLASDAAPMLGVIQHAIGALAEAGWTSDLVVLLQPTAPFRRARDVQAAVDLLRVHPEADSVVSVEQVPSHYAPHYVMKIAGGLLEPFLSEGAGLARRQDAPKVYTRNGQFYVSRGAALAKGSIYGERSLPYVTSHRAVNLDSQEDWAEAEALAASIGFGGA